MNKMRFMLTTLAAFALTITFASAAQAVSFRTFVRSNGDNINTATNCGQSNPCRTLALTRTFASG